MIKFFRKIRYTLMEQNKTGRYFKYAIGEIILVVIGILIALQINNWNENRKDYSKETAILESINKEFTKNKKQLDSVVGWHKLNLQNCNDIIALFPINSKPSAIVLDSLSAYLWDSYGGVTFNPSQSSIKALTNTSSFEIIKNDSLRELLIAWGDLVEDYQEEELQSRDYLWQQYDPYMSKHFDFKFNFNDPRSDIDALQSLEFEFLVKSRHDLLDQILNSSGELQKLEKSLNDIITLSNLQAND